VNQRTERTPRDANLLFFCKRPLLRDSSDAVKTVAKRGSLFDLQGVLRFGVGGSKQRAARAARAASRAEQQASSKLNGWV
jgi:hypothetical protein